MIATIPTINAHFGIELGLNAYFGIELGLRELLSVY